MENKTKFLKVNNPITDYAGQSVSTEYFYKDIAIVAPNTAVLCEVSSAALRDALLNTPELLEAWGLELVPIRKKEQAPKKVQPKKEEIIEEPKEN